MKPVGLINIMDLDRLNKEWKESGLRRKLFLNFSIFVYIFFGILIFGSLTDSVRSWGHYLASYVEFIWDQTNQNPFFSSVMFAFTIILMAAIPIVMYYKVFVDLIVKYLWMIHRIKNNKRSY